MLVGNSFQLSNIREFKNYDTEIEFFWITNLNLHAVFPIKKRLML